MMDSVTDSVKVRILWFAGEVNFTPVLRMTQPCRAHSLLHLGFCIHAHTRSAGFVPISSIKSPPLI